MAKAREIKFDVNVEMAVSEKTLGRCLRIVEEWLEDHPDKTIVVEEEHGVRVCLIAEKEELDAEKQGA